MLFVLQVPTMNDRMLEATVLRVLVEPGTRIERGTPLVEMRVDLGAIFAQNCAPIFDVRVVANEGGWLRRVEVARGGVAAVGAPLAIVSSAPEESLEAPVARPLRVNIGVIPFIVAL